MPSHSVSAPVERGLRALGWTLGAGAVAGAGTLAWSAGVEVRSFVTRRFEVPVLPAGHRPLKVLHVSDLHLTPSQGVKRRWLASLADLEPDLVVNTGDNLAHLDAVDPVLEGFGALLDVPGVFVFGSNDYFAPKPRNPLWYLFPDDGRRNTHTQSSRGATCVPASPRRLDRADQHLGPAAGRRHEHRLRRRRRPPPGVRRPRRRSPGRPPTTWTCASASPTRRTCGCSTSSPATATTLTLAGHTHGGQVCLPFKGALVTNCDLDTGRAKGLHRHPADSRPGDPGSSWLHVSAGAGTSPYSPVRLCCRPEATLLTLVPKGS